MKFLQRLFGGYCAHRFAWPRTDENGQHYQICLSCGTAYEYDWRMMRRTSRLLVVETNTGNLLAGSSPYFR